MNGCGLLGCWRKSLGLLLHFRLFGVTFSTAVVVGLLTSAIQAPLFLPLFFLAFWTLLLFTLPWFQSGAPHRSSLSPGSLGLWVVNASSWVDCPCAAITKLNMSVSKSPCLGENTLQNKKLLYYTAKRHVPCCSKCHLEGSSSGHISGMCEGPGTTNLSPEFRQLGQVLARLLVVELVQADQAAKPAFAATASAACVASAGQLPGQSWHDENCHAWKKSKKGIQTLSKIWVLMASSTGALTTWRSPHVESNCDSSWGCCLRENGCRHTQHIDYVMPNITMEKTGLRQERLLLEQTRQVSWFHFFYLEFLLHTTLHLWQHSCLGVLLLSSTHWCKDYL